MTKTETKTSDNGIERPDSFEMTGKCGNCGGTMIEVFALVNNNERHVKLECQHCGAESENRHDYGSNPEDGSWPGVENPETKPVLWIDCQRCYGHGEIEDPICDLRRAMNGREHPCPNCNGSGTVPCILENDGDRFVRADTDH